MENKRSVTVVAALVREGNKFLIGQRPEPQRLEHQDFRWITPGEIDDVVFCPADVDVLAKIKAEFPAGGAN